MSRSDHHVDVERLTELPSLSRDEEGPVFAEPDAYRHTPHGKPMRLPPPE
ncbi:MAG: hypothetical protein VYE68_08720 [Acidobacteriota bacterium]|nr:hypothetical protein [Acidobacteriota bacterium]